MSSPERYLVVMDTWNTHKILADCGGPVDLHAKLKAAGHDIGLPAVRAWGRRGNIPGSWIPAIVKTTGKDPRAWIMEDIW